jgi:hypothetical protein
MKSSLEKRKIEKNVTKKKYQGDERLELSLSDDMLRGLQCEWPYKRLLADSS